VKLKNFLGRWGLMHAQGLPLALCFLRLEIVRNRLSMMRKGRSSSYPLLFLAARESIEQDAILSFLQFVVSHAFQDLSGSL